MSMSRSMASWLEFVLLESQSTRHLQVLPRRHLSICHSVPSCPASLVWHRPMSRWTVWVHSSCHWMAFLRPSCLVSGRCPRRPLLFRPPERERERELERALLLAPLPAVETPNPRRCQDQMVLTMDRRPAQPVARSVQQLVARRAQPMDPRVEQSHRLQADQSYLKGCHQRGSPCPLVWLATHPSVRLREAGPIPNRHRRQCLWVVHRSSCSPRLPATSRQPCRRLPVPIPMARSRFSRPPGPDCPKNQSFPQLMACPSCPIPFARLNPSLLALAEAD